MNTPNKYIYQSTAFALRSFQEGDEMALVKHANNIKIFNNVRDVFPHPYTLDDAVWWVDANKNSQAPFNTLAIEIEGEVVGGIGIVLGNDIYRSSAEIGYWLGESYWGKGIMSAVVKVMTDYVFQHFPDIVRLWAGIFEYNKASMRVVEKAGYHLESIQKKACIKNGQVIDAYLYVCFRAD